MIYLLDVNVLIALVDSSHALHSRAQSWFHGRPATDGWATCPITENGFLRIMGNPNYKGVIGDPQALRVFLQRICSWPGHQFWPDSISLRDLKFLPKLTTSKQVTDLYLLALAVSEQGAFATMDERIDPSLIPNGAGSLLVLP